MPSLGLACAFARRVTYLLCTLSLEHGRKLLCTFAPARLTVRSCHLTGALSVLYTDSAPVKFQLRAVSRAGAKVHKSHRPLGCHAAKEVSQWFTVLGVQRAPGNVDRPSLALGEHVERTGERVGHRRLTPLGRGVVCDRIRNR